ncbi:Histidine kinase-, DNA gyrase B-, and HSP90-like ATPase [Thermoactinomyces sp. DSM 45891]|nr:Histidine kinase-, DNA gyrase B-, and HSP90-like ATPase [Thermoactinomyces sp. DSM 45891]
MNLFPLLTNAIRYTSGDNIKINNILIIKSGEVYLSVRDKGWGIAPEDIPVFYWRKTGVFGQAMIVFEK